MTKQTLITKEELKSKKEKLKNDILRLEKIIEASSKTTFEIIIEDLKVRMVENIKEEQWQQLKNSIKEVDSVKGTQSFIEAQSTLLDKKQEELKNIEEQLKYYQTSLFDKEEEEERVPTDFFNANGEEFITGDVYEEKRKEGTIYFLIKKSSEIKGSFAITSNSLEGESLMQYEKNLEMLNSAIYIGNIYDKFDNQEEALRCKKIIEDYQDGLKAKDNNDNQND